MSPDVRYVSPEPPDLETIQVKDDSRYSRSLYVSHFLSTWNSRGFEFSAVLSLASIFPGTLLPMSIYALFRALSAILLSGYVGKYIDATNRLATVRLSIVGQRLAVALSCVIFLVLLTFIKSASETMTITLFVTSIILACVEKLCITVNTIAVERDWVVVIAGENERCLQLMNSQMRRIDLFCKLISPLTIALIDGFSTKIAILTTLVLNLTSVAAEYFLIAWVYRRTPALANPKNTLIAKASSAGPDTPRTSTSLFKQTRNYVKSHAFLPSLALSIPYLTVLSFGGQMTTYLLAIPQPQISSISIGLIRFAATFLEISATFVAPALVNRLGAVRSGMWSLTWQSLCLIPGIATFWTATAKDISPFFTTCVFIISVVFSRVGLWSFDLVAQLLVQNSIDADQRGSFSATEAGLQNLFELCTLVMTIVWSKPEQFKYPASISLLATFLAAAIYARYVRVERGHLLHVPLCCGIKHDYARLERTGHTDNSLELEDQTQVVG